MNPITILRIGAGLCFISHGALALSGKLGFITLLGSLGIDESTANYMLKIIGCLDIAVGLLILFKPGKLVLIWATAWAALTIVAWGVHGDSTMDLLRRITYVTTPLALMAILYQNKSLKDEAKSKSVSNQLTVVPVDREKAIDNLDLSMICMKLMDEEGWSERQCDEVALEYRRYLKLNLLYPESSIVPNRAVDAMWHYHILDTEAYYKRLSFHFRAYSASLPLLWNARQNR